MHLYALIGWPLGHSFSQKYFTEKFEREGIEDARYELFPLGNIADLPHLLAQNPGLCGLSVTIPHKETVIPFLHDLDETARAVGAVNCIKVFENQRLVGYNTDVLGFEKSLLTADGLPKAGGRWTSDGAAALILGTGGAAKAVAFVLKKLGIPYLFVSRNPKRENEISYEDLEKTWAANHQSSIINHQSSIINHQSSIINHQSSIINHQSSIIVNTTPLGSFPRVGEMPPVPPDFFRPGMFVYDLIYNPAETLLLREAKSRGCTVKNGLEMLELQAEAAWEIWQGDR
ncbi:MAG: shikimate dehydrogenase family protein [Saprospiraceae bacterium]